MAEQNCSDHIGVLNDVYAMIETSFLSLKQVRCTETESVERIVGLSRDTIDGVITEMKAECVEVADA